MEPGIIPRPSRFEPSKHAFPPSMQFHVVIPVHQPTGLWDRVIGAFDPARWAKAFARWIVEGVHGTLCGAVEEASGTNPSKCGGR